jgi:hypothetical protein
MRRDEILLAFMLVFLVSIWGCGPAADIDLIYYRFTPLVIDQSRVANVVLEAKVTGSPSTVKLQLEATGSEISMVDDGSGDDVTAGDGVYTVSIAMTHILFNFTADDVYRNFIGFLRPYSGATYTKQYNIFVDIIDASVPSVTITPVSASVQYSEYLVNIVRPVFFIDFDISTLLQQFYTHFEDHYDFVNVIYDHSYIQNRHHFGIKNEVQNIGHSLFDNTAAYGSSGRLQGCTVFPNTTLFDGASPTYQHELGHQWINFISLVPLNVAIPHWPLSDLASGIMGWGNAPGGQGLNFNYDLVPAGANYNLVTNTNPKEFKDLSLYLMGFAPASSVGSHFVFDDQSQSIAGGTLNGPVTMVTISDITGSMGSRIPNHTNSQKRFRIATIIVSRDGLLSADAMRLYDYFSQRAEGTAIVPFSSGFLKGNSKPFYLSTQQKGELDTRIKRNILVDASRDGGEWWFPQTGPFDVTANHQGKALADYLKSLGNTVTELPRPYTITTALLADYDVVIRAVGFSSYTAAELTAYQDYVQDGGKVLLLADHHANDGLATSFGIHFQAVTRGANMLSNYTVHPLTNGVGSLFYNVGSGVTSYPTGAQIIGRLSATSYLDLNYNNIKDVSEPSGPDVLGVMTLGKGGIIFCGDTNLWLAVPQPLTDNFLAWVNGP